MLRKTIALLSILTLSACAPSKPDSSPNEVHLSPQLVMHIPAYRYTGEPREIAQLVTATYDGKTFVFEAHLSINQDRLRMVGLDPFSRKALTIDWSAQGVTSEVAPWVPEGLHPENILADIIILYAPEKTVRSSVNGNLKTNKNSRVISQNGEEIIHADYKKITANDPWVGKADYINNAWHYRLNIESVDVK